MFDTHYDLLTYIYMKRKNLKFIKDYCKKVYCKSNITGGIFNLFYMSEQEMEEEINIKKEEIDVIKNLSYVKEVIEKNHLLPKDIKYIFGIEGLDYLEKIDDIDILYDLGLRSTNIVWNNENKFGTGAKGDIKRGLTKLGEELIIKLVNKKIAIDLSHANEETFYDIIGVCKKLKKENLDPIVFASHSNCKNLCDVPRNLNDDQIMQINDLGGVIGVVSIKRFVKKENNINKLSTLEYENEYIKHIYHIKKLTGGVNSICIATDDMRYYEIEPEYYQNANIYKHEKVAKKIQDLLESNYFQKEEVTKIMYQNFEDKIINRL